MFSKIASLRQFTRDTARLVSERVRNKGWWPGWILLETRVLDFLIHQANKRPLRRRVECPCCGWTGYDFMTFEAVYFWKRSSFCPRCESQDRQRLLNLYITRRHPELFSGPMTLLHVAPGTLEKKLIFRNPQVNYLSTDCDFDEVKLRKLERSRGRRTASTDYDLDEAERYVRHGRGFCGDIQDLALASQAVDIVFCIHVLEHVRNPNAGLSEVARVLRPGGTAYIMVPFEAGLPKSVEWDEPNPDIFDHIWNYSQNDFKDRLADFEYEEIVPASFLSPAERSRYRIDDTEVIYRCVKPSG